jgi:hypothetical protein
MQRVHPPQQFAFVEAKRDGVIGLARTRLPRRLLSRKHLRQPVEIGDEVTIDRLVEREESRLMRQQLPNGDSALYSANDGQYLDTRSS